MLILSAINHSCAAIYYLQILCAQIAIITWQMQFSLFIIRLFIFQAFKIAKHLDMLYLWYRCCNILFQDIRISFLHHKCLCWVLFVEEYKMMCHYTLVFITKTPLKFKCMYSEKYCRQLRVSNVASLLYTMYMEEFLFVSLILWWLATLWSNRNHGTMY